MNAVAEDVDRVMAVRAFLRQRARAPSPRETLSRIAYQLYIVALFLGIYGTAVAKTLAAPASTSAPVSGAAADLVPAVVVGLALIATMTGLRLGTWAGPVLVSRAEAAWILPAPLDRRRVLGRNLAVGLGGFAVGGGVIGALVGVVTALETRAGVAGPLFGTALGWASLGLVTGAGSLAVESSSIRARWMLRGTVWIILLAAGVLWLTTAAPAIAIWTTPWGWASAPVAAAVGVSVPLAWLPPFLLAAVASLTTVLAVRHLPAIPDEQLVRRAGAASGVRASAAVFDARAIAQARRSGQQWVIGHRRVRLHRPHRRWLLIAWRDTVSLMRRRGALERTTATVAGAGVLVAWARGGVAASIVVLLVLSASVAQLLEPLRIELEEPIVSEFSTMVPLDVVLEHTAIPMLILSVMTIGTLVGVAAFTTMPWAAVGAGVVGVVAMSALLTSAAALASTRGSPPLHWLTYGASASGATTGAEFGVILVIGWMLSGPLLALVVGLPPVLITVAQLRDGMAPMAAVARPALFVVTLAGALMAATYWRAKRRLGD